MCRLAAAALLAGVLCGSPLPGEVDGRLRLVAEMERPDGIRYENVEARRELGRRADSEAALARFRTYARDLWPAIRRVDLEALSRFQLDSMRGYVLRESPGELEGQVIARELGGRLHLELRGPRLPASYDIVHRYLYLYAVYDPARDSFAKVTVTIRGWILE